MVEKEYTLHLRNDLENFVCSMHFVKEDSSLTQAERNSLSTIANEGKNWLKANPNATNEELKAKNNEWSYTWDPIKAKL